MIENIDAITALAESVTTMVVLLLWVSDLRRQNTELRKENGAVVQWLMDRREKLEEEAMKEANQRE